MEPELRFRDHIALIRKRERDFSDENRGFGVQSEMFLSILSLILWL